MSSASPPPSPDTDSSLGDAGTGVHTHHLYSESYNIDPEDIEGSEGSEESDDNVSGFGVFDSVDYEYVEVGDPDTFLGLGWASSSESGADNSNNSEPDSFEVGNPDTLLGLGWASSSESGADSSNNSEPGNFRHDSYPLSPDLEGELELAILAEMENQLPPLRARMQRAANGEDGVAAPTQSGNGASAEEPDVLVDLELYFSRNERQQRRPQNQQGPADVIDLTNEPDSPVLNHAPRPSANPRRQNSQGRNPPSFSRSDSSILAGNAPVIDLTEDSPEVPRRRRPQHAPPIPPQGRPFSLHNPAHAFSGLSALRHLYPFRLFPGHQDDDVQLLGILQDRINPGDLNNPLGNIQLQYENGAFDRAESPKPVHQAPPPAKSGFTRDTGSDLVFICPSCNDELAYDPDVPTGGSQPARKGKRARSEHHFWALKACGHVYCEDCFENRRPAAKRPNTGFPRDDDSKVICAVDGCDSQATNKTAWVGIYL